MFKFNKTVIASCALLLLSGCAGNKKSGSLSSTGINSSNLVSDFEKQVGDRVFFNLDSSNLSVASKKILDTQAHWLVTHPAVKAEIQGHCDERGPRDYNIALGERRANAVKEYLVGKGINGGRLMTISYGKERPAVIGHDELAWSQNRRSVTIIKVK